MPDPRESQLGTEIDEEHEVRRRHQILALDLDRAGIHAQLALIRQGGVITALLDDPFALPKRGDHPFLDMPGAVLLKQGQLGFGIGRPRRIAQPGADGLAPRSVARLKGVKHRQPQGAKPLDETACQMTLAGSIDPFQDDKIPLLAMVHSSSLARLLPSCQPKPALRSCLIALLSLWACAPETKRPELAQKTPIQSVEPKTPAHDEGPREALRLRALEFALLSDPDRPGSTRRGFDLRLQLTSRLPRPVTQLRLMFILEMVQDGALLPIPGWRFPVELPIQLPKDGRIDVTLTDLLLDQRRPPKASALRYRIWPLSYQIAQLQLPDALWLLSEGHAADQNAALDSPEGLKGPERESVILALLQTLEAPSPRPSPEDALRLLYALYELGALKEGRAVSGLHRLHQLPAPVKARYQAAIQLLAERMGEASGGAWMPRMRLLPEGLSPLDAALAECLDALGEAAVWPLVKLRAEDPSPGAQNVTQRMLAQLGLRDASEILAAAPAETLPAIIVRLAEDPGPELPEALLGLALDPKLSAAVKAALLQIGGPAIAAVSADRRLGDARWPLLLKLSEAHPEAWARFLAAKALKPGPSAMKQLKARDQAAHEAEARRFRARLQALLDEGAPERAVRLYEREDPGGLPALWLAGLYRQLGEAMVAAGDTEAAVLAFAQSLKWTPSSRVHAALFKHTRRLLLGLGELGQGERAEPILRELGGDFSADERHRLRSELRATLPAPGLPRFVRFWLWTPLVGLALAAGLAWRTRRAGKT